MLTEIEKIIELSRHAPSSHNTQPWQVRVEKDSLIIGYNPDRQLTVGDPKKREMFMSLGCFVETSLKAAVITGCSARYSFIGQGPANVARVDLATTKKNPKETNWEVLIKSRRSDRRLYSESKIPKKVLTTIGSETEHPAAIVMVTDTDKISFLAQMTYDATLRAMSPADFRNELASWVRNNWTNKADGMPAYVQGMPGPVSLLAKPIIKKIRQTATSQAKKDSSRVERSAAVGLIYIADNFDETPESWISAGRLMQRVCLLALAEGVKSAAISAAVIEAKTAEEIQNKLPIPGKPVALIRFGYTKNTPKGSPRRTVADILKAS